MFSAAAQSTDSMGAASIASATALIQGALDRDFVGGQSAKARAFSLDNRGWVRDRFEEDRNVAHRREDTQYRRAVTDARAAGLHPLFALGRAGSFSGGYGGGSRASAAGIPPSGSLGRAGVAQAGQEFAKYLLGKRPAEMAEARLASQLKVDDALANLYNSQAARAAQEAISGPRVGEDGAIVYPLGAKPGLPLEAARTHISRRPLVAKPNVSAPLRQELIGDDGYRYRVLTDDAGDELKQVDLVYQGIARMTRKARLALPREVQIQYHRWQRRRGAAARRNRAEWERTKRPLRRKYP